MRTISTVRKRLLTCGGIALAIALQFSTSAAAQTGTSTATQDAQTSAPADTRILSEAIDRVAQAAVSDGISPGLQIALFKNGVPLLVKTYGYADLELQVPATNETVFRVGSVTKQFTACAILKLQEEGKLSIDDKLSKYFPRFPDADNITIKQMLQHTSGIHSYGSGSIAQMERRSTTEMIDYLASRPKLRDFEPGSSWSYSNAGYYIVGAIVEKIEGEPLAAVFQRRFFQPLGMAHTALDDETEIVRGRAEGYQAEGPRQFKNAEFTSMSFPGGAGAMRSTASDLARWNAALFGGKLLKPQSFAAMTAPGSLANGQSTGPIINKQYGKPSDYGLGIEMAIVGGHRKVSHGGGIDGFSASLSQFPQDSMTIVILSNTIGKGVGTSDLADRIEQLALGVAQK